jgi:hypothetical protein
MYHVTSSSIAKPHKHNLQLPGLVKMHHMSCKHAAIAAQTAASCRRCRWYSSGALHKCTCITAPRAGRTLTEAHQTYTRDPLLEGLVFRRDNVELHAQKQLNQVTGASAHALINASPVNDTYAFGASVWWTSFNSACWAEASDSLWTVPTCGCAAPCITPHAYYSWHTDLCWPQPLPAAGSSARFSVLLALQPRPQQRRGGHGGPCSGRQGCAPQRSS